MVKLCCTIVGVAGSAFSVRVDESDEPDSVDDLMDAIKKNKPNTIKGEADKLQLFLAKNTDGKWLDGAGVTAVTVDEARAEPVMVDEHGDQQGFKKMDPTLYLKNKKHFGVNFQPCDDQIHVLVVVPKEIAHHRYKPRDSSKEWLTELFTKRVEFHSLPFVGSLSSYTAQSLPVKIRAKKKWLVKWNLSPELQEKIFVIDDAAPCKEFKGLIFGKRALKRFRCGRTESSYHIVWDFVIRNVLDHIFSRARIDRDSDIGSVTRKKRPDFFFILNDVCVFRGEESSPDVSIDVPTAELCSNLEWEYGSVPYVFGYAASGFNVDLLALHRDDDKIVTKTHIGSFNFEVTEDVFRTVLAILNLSLLFPAIVEACPASGKC